MTPETFIIFKVQAIGTKVLKLFSNSGFQTTENPQTGYCITCQPSKKTVKGIYDVCSDTSKPAEKVKNITIVAAGFICTNRTFLKGEIISKQFWRIFFFYLELSCLGLIFT